jgi:hypothetical protein
MVTTPIPDLNQTKNYNKTQPSDFHQSSLRKKNKIPVKKHLTLKIHASIL